MNNKDLAREWFLLAEKDLASAQFLLNMKPRPLEIICYHCQQSAEKYLKGFIVFHGGESLKTHDLDVLNKHCIEYDSQFNKIQDHCINLTDYSVHVRYPFHIDLEDKDVDEALDSALSIQGFVLKKISGD